LQIIGKVKQSMKSYEKHYSLSKDKPSMQYKILESKFTGLYNKRRSDMPRIYYEYLWKDNAGIEHYIAFAMNCSVSLTERYWFLSGKAVPLDTWIYNETSKHKTLCIYENGQPINVFNFKMFYNESLWYTDGKPVPFDVPVYEQWNRYFVRNADRTWTEVYCTRKLRSQSQDKEDCKPKLLASDILTDNFHSDFIFRQQMTYFATSKVKLLHEESVSDKVNLREIKAFAPNPEFSKKRKHSSELDSSPSPKKFKAENGQAVSVEKPVDNEQQACSSINHVTSEQWLNNNNRVVDSYLLFFTGVEDKIEDSLFHLPLWRAFISSTQQIASWLYPSLLGIYEQMPWDLVKPIPGSSIYKTNQTLFPNLGSQRRERYDYVMQI
jgi:hypothetical protein